MQVIFTMSKMLLSLSLCDIYSLYFSIHTHNSLTELLIHFLLDIYFVAKHSLPYFYEFENIHSSFYALFSFALARELQISHCGAFINGMGSTSTVYSECFV